MCAAVPELSDEENQRIYGLAANPHGHGHNYVLEVEPRGRSRPGDRHGARSEGAEAILTRHVVDVYDHRFLNYEVPPFERVVPTPENIARDIWRRLEPHLNSGRGRLRTVRVYETPDLYVDYSGEQSCSA